MGLFLLMIENRFICPNKLTYKEQVKENSNFAFFKKDFAKFTLK